MRFPIVAGCALALSVAAGAEPLYRFENLAGSTSGGGFRDGTGADARFSRPSGVAVDAEGNCYVADTHNFTVRRISSAGKVETLAGSAGQRGLDDGSGAAARFLEPRGIAIDASGTLYVADSSHVRKISAGGVVSSFPHAFNGAVGIALDAEGNVFVAVQFSHVIQKISPSGQLSTVAGTLNVSGGADGVGENARFFRPADVAVGSDGSIFVVDSYNSTIRKIAPSGEVTTLAGVAGMSGVSSDGTGADARFSDPRGVVVDANGDVYVTDGTRAVRKITPAGVVTTVCGSAGASGSQDGAGVNARFNGLIGIAAGSGGKLFLADSLNHAIRLVSATGVVSTLAGAAPRPGANNGSGSAAGFRSPTGVAVDAVGNAYIADSANHVIRMVSPGGVVSTIAGTLGVSGFVDGTGSQARFDYPSGVTLDAEGNIYVADLRNRRVRKIGSDRSVTTIAGSGSSPASGTTGDGNGSAARFSAPEDVVIDGSGNIFVVDSSAGTVRKIAPNGDVTTLAGASGQSGSVDGLGANARFNIPRGIAIDGQGNLYVADANAAKIRKVTTAGLVSTVVDFLYTGRTVADVAVGSDGSLFVADEFFAAVYRVATDGTVSLVGGRPRSYGAAAGIQGNARFDGPRGLAVAPDGSIYVTDGRNHAVFRGTLFEPKIAWSRPAEIERGTALSSVQLNATADVPGTFTYTPETGAVLAVGQHTLSVLFRPEGAIEHAGFSKEVSIEVTRARPSVSWATPAGIGYGTALSSAQLNATSDVSGTFVYSPASGTVLDAGASRTLSLTFTPTDANAYQSVTATRVLTVAKAPLIATAANKARVQGQENPLLTVEYQGFLNGDTTAVMDEAPKASTAATKASGTGEYPIVLTGGSDGNYELILRNGTLTVAPFTSAPGFAVEPSAQNASIGQTVSFSVQVSGAPTPSFEWQVSTNGGTSWSPVVNGDTYTGAATASLSIVRVAESMNGYRYRVIAKNSAGSATSASATLMITPSLSLAGTYFGDIAGGGGKWALRVNADRSAIFVAFLSRRESAIVANLTVSEFGSFSTTTAEKSAPLTSRRAIKAIRLDDAGHATIEAASETFTLSGSISNQAVSGHISGVDETFVGLADSAAGPATAGFYSASAVGAPGEVYSIVGASGQTLVLIVVPGRVDVASSVLDSSSRLSATTANGGTLALSLVAGNVPLSSTFTPVGGTMPIQFGQTSIEEPEPNPNPEPPPGNGGEAGTRLVALAARAAAGSGDQTLIMGFVVSGGKQVLVQGVGPGIASSVPTALTDPQLKLYRLSGGAWSEEAENNDWVNGAEILEARSRLGASAVAQGSKDAALLEDLSGGVYTAHVTSGGAAGVALVEAYDADADGSSRLLALATRTVAGAGDATLIAGFVLQGTGPKTVLIRALGPELALRDVQGVLADPKLTLYRGANVVGSNDDWGGTQELKAAFAAVNSGGLTSDTSKDAALLVTLNPGAYTVHVTGAAGTTGVALVEIFDVE